LCNLYHSLDWSRCYERGKKEVELIVFLKILILGKLQCSNFVLGSIIAGARLVPVGLPHMIIPVKVGPTLGVDVFPAAAIAC